MKIALHEGDVSIFEFINEIDPTAQTPVKAMVHLKDHGEIRISDNSKFKNVRNLKVKARWSAAKRVVHGKISFPASLEEPLYLDLDVGVADEAHQDLSLFKATSSSVLEFSNSFSFTTEYDFQCHHRCLLNKVIMQPYNKCFLQECYTLAGLKMGIWTGKWVHE